MAAYTRVLLAIGVILNIALLRNVKQILKNSPMHKTLDSNLIKTIAIILAVQLVKI